MVEVVGMSIISGDGLVEVAAITTGTVGTTTSGIMITGGDGLVEVVTSGIITTAMGGMEGTTTSGIMILGVAGNHPHGTTMDGIKTDGKMMDGTMTAIAMMTELKGAGVVCPIAARLSSVELTSTSTTAS